MAGLAVRGSDGRELLLAPPARHRHGRWSTPVQIRTRAVAALVLACCLAGLTAVLLSQLRGEFQSIGQRDAPEAGATTTDDTQIKLSMESMT